MNQPTRHVLQTSDGFSVELRFDEAGRIEQHVDKLAKPTRAQRQRIWREYQPWRDKSQRLIPTGERSGLWTRIATMENVTLCTRMKS
jgi:hypothetical protein